MGAPDWVVLRLVFDDSDDEHAASDALVRIAPVTTNLRLELGMIPEISSRKEGVQTGSNFPRFGGSIVLVGHSGRPRMAVF